MPGMVSSPASPVRLLLAALVVSCCSHSFSAGNSSVAYAADQDIEDTREVYAVNSKTGLDTKVNSELGNQPLTAYAIDSRGTKIAWSVTSSNGKSVTPNGGLFLTDLATSTIRDLIPDMVTSGSVHTFEIHPKATSVVYMGNTENVDEIELFVVDLKSGLKRQINSPLPLESRVDDFRINAKGSDVAYVAEEAVEGQEQLILFNLKTSLRTVLINPSGPLGISEFEFDPKGQNLYFAADLITPGKRELFRVNIRTGETTGISGPILPGTGDVSGSIVFNSKGSRLLYRADQEVDSVFELYMVDLKTNFITKVSGPMASGGDVDPNEYAFDASGANVYYKADQLEDSRTELFRYNIASGVTDTVNLPLVESGDVKSFLFHPKGTGVYYCADQEVNGMNEIYSYSAATGVVVKISPVLLPGRSIGDDFKLDVRKKGIFFIGDLEVLDHRELFRLDLKTLLAVQVSAPMPTDRNVRSFIVPGDRRARPE